MECPKCHKIISDDAVVCPHCHKVLSLVCPNCKTLGHDAVCGNCGYIILEKCSKCGRTVSTSAKKCKCGFPTLLSVAYNECETDEFASLEIKFGSLKSIRRILASKELFNKFRIKLKNLLTAQIKNAGGNTVIYGDTYVVNFNKELSFSTSSNKAIRCAVKVANAFAFLNQKLTEEMGIPLNLNLTILKKTSEELLTKKSFELKVKMLNVNKAEKKYLKGMQVIIDENVNDAISKAYKTDTYYSSEQDGKSLMLYELILDKYVLKPNSREDSDNNEEIISKNNIIKKDNVSENPKRSILSVKVLDINAKCKFEEATAETLLNKLDTNKIISIRGERDLGVKTSDIINYYRTLGMKVLTVTCTEELNFRPWGVCGGIIREYLGITDYSKIIPQGLSAGVFQNLLNLSSEIPQAASTPEDARFAYIDDFIRFFNSLQNAVIIIDGFEYIDDTSIQLLELYFDKFNNVKPKFVFITDDEISLHSKIRGLLRTSLYTEIRLLPVKIETMLTNIKVDASDFIKSFYFEKIRENYNGSRLYFDNALKLLNTKEVVVLFENKLLIRSNASVVIPSSLEEIFKARFKLLSKNNEASMILAYFALIGAKLNRETLQKLGITQIEKNLEILEKEGFVYTKNDLIYLNNYNLVKPVILEALKKDAEQYLVKNVLAKLGQELDTSATMLLMGKIALFKDEYLLLWKNSKYAMEVGDFDSYLKNCFGFLSLLEHVADNVNEEEIENNKKEIYQNIIMSLYSYSPEKIYSIEKILLIDAINNEDNEQIIKLSNLMLQGALISSNYTEALKLLHNILSKMENPVLVVNGAVNTKFLLLSLINIEIQFNTGDYQACIETAEELLEVIKPSILEKIKPASFSLNLFVSHIMETFRLAAFAKVLTLDYSLENFYESVKNSIGEELIDKQAITAIRDYFAGKEPDIPRTEDMSSFSKVIYLILQEFSDNINNPKTFAQNIYQAKLLSADLHQTILEKFCDILIASSYAKLGAAQKAESIYKDVIEKSENSAMFNICIIAKYFMAKLKISRGEVEGAMLIINDSLAIIQKNNESAKLVEFLFEKLLIETVKEHQLKFIDSEIEEQKLAQIAPNNELARLN